MQSSNGDTDIGNRLTDMVGRGGGDEEGEGGMYGRSTWKYTLPYVKQITNENLLYDSGNSNQGSEIT